MIENNKKRSCFRYSPIQNNRYILLLLVYQISLLIFYFGVQYSRMMLNSILSKSYLTTLLQTRSPVNQELNVYYQSDKRLIVQKAQLFIIIILLYYQQMNFNQQVFQTQNKSQKSLNSHQQNFNNSSKKIIPNTPLLSKHPTANKINNRDDIKNKEKFLDLKNLKTPIIKQISLDTEPQYFKGKRPSAQTISNDVEKAKFLQIQTTRTVRTSQIDRNNTMKIQETHQISTEQRNKKYFKSDCINNDKILDLLLLNTQELKGFFQKEKEPPQRAKPRINNVKGFPSDFFSVL